MKNSVVTAQPKRGPVTVRSAQGGGKVPRGALAPARPRKAKVKVSTGRTPTVLPTLVVKAVLGLIVLCTIFISYRAVIASSIFEIEHFEVSGNLHASEEEIRRLMRAATRNKSLMEVDLDAVRREVESKPLVRRAYVARILPDTLRVIIDERVPVALARKESGAFVWLSSDAVELGDLDLFRQAKMPPLLVGISENDESDVARRDNRERVELYQKIIQDLGSDVSAVEEIDLSTLYPSIVRFQLKDSRIVVDVNDRDYHSRLRAALEVINAARRGDRVRLAELHIPNIPTLIEQAAQISMVHVNSRISISLAAPLRAAQARTQSNQTRSVPPKRVAQKAK